MFGNRNEQPPPMDPEEVKNAVALAMLDVVGALEPVYDAADGMRRDLEARGWSPAMAEQAAGTWLCSALMTFGGAGR